MVLESIIYQGFPTLTKESLDFLGIYASCLHRTQVIQQNVLERGIFIDFEYTRTLSFRELQEANLLHQW